MSWPQLTEPHLIIVPGTHLRPFVRVGKEVYGWNNDSSHPVLMDIEEWALKDAKRYKGPLDDEYWRLLQAVKFLLMSRETKITKEDIGELERLGREAVPHTGHCTVVYIVELLRRGDLRSAQAVYQNDGDKLSGYPKVLAQSVKVLGCRTHLKHDCVSWLCKPRGKQ